MQTISFLLFRLLAFVVKNHLKREKKIKKKSFFPFTPTPSPGYPQDPDPDPDPHEDFCPDPDPEPIFIGPSQKIQYCLDTTTFKVFNIIIKISGKKTVDIMHNSLKLEWLNCKSSSHTLAQFHP